MKETKTLTTKEFIKEVAETIDVTQKDAEMVLRGICDVAYKNLVEGNGVKFPKLATFETCEVKEKKARNPQTGEEMTVPAHTKVRTKICKTLRDAVRA